MARNQGRMALYEAIRKSQKKIVSPNSAHLKPRTRITERKKTKKPEKKPVKTLQTAAKWPPKEKPAAAAEQGPKLVSFRNLIIAIAAVLTIFVAIKIGQKFTSDSLPFSEENNPSPVENEVHVGGNTDSQDTVDKKVNETETTQDDTGDDEATLKPVGSNVIVIATYGTERDLRPVQEYFADNGIGTEILQRLPYYFLITKQRYDNPNHRGSDGWNAKQKIKEIGAGYKAPKGFEPFGSKPFQDAYGMKLQ